MSHYREQKGFVLLLVLIFMQILLLLNWYAIENSVLLEKFSKNANQHDVLYYQAQAILADAGLLLMSHLPDCMISVTDSNEMILKPLSWWTAKSCSGNFQSIQYYYVVEPLATDVCALIDQIANVSAAYFRITVFLYSAKDDSRFFLQSTWIRPNVSQESCKNLPHSVQAGRQSWRELT